MVHCLSLADTVLRAEVVSDYRLTGSPNLHEIGDDPTRLVALAAGKSEGGLRGYA